MSNSVTASLNYTRNLGNYESVKVSVGVTADVLDGESTDEAYDRVYAFVEKKLLEKVDEIESELKR